MTRIFSLLPQGSKDYLTCVVVMAIGIIFYSLGQMGLAMMFFSVGIVLFMFFSYTYSFHMWRASGDDDVVDDDTDDDIIDDEDDDGYSNKNENIDDDADVDNDEDKG
jgi:hypothetical protein